LATLKRHEMWVAFAGQALAGNLSRNAYTDMQAELAAKAADKMMEEFLKRYEFKDLPGGGTSWWHKKEDK
jgi:hypothetical protein